VLIDGVIRTLSESKHNAYAASHEPTRAAARGDKMKTTQPRSARCFQIHPLRFAALAGAVAFSGLAAPLRSADAQELDQAINPSRLGDLYARVARANPKIIAAQALVRAAQARVPGATRPPDPQLQLGIMNRSLPRLAPMRPLGMTQLQVMQMVPLGGKLTFAGRVAAAQADEASARAEDIVWELRSETAMAFYDLYATNRQLDVARETLRLLQDISRTAQSIYRLGEGRQADVLRANVEIAKMAQDTIRMHAMRTTMAARLNALLNREADESLTVVARPQFPDTMPAPTWLESAAMAGRPMIRAGLQAVRAADGAAALARKDVIPDLQIGVQYARGASTMVDVDGMTSTKTENMGSLMIGASIPIFARDRQSQTRNEAEAMRAMALADVNAMRADTRGKIGEAYANLTAARTLAHLYRTTVLPQAEATVASALASYRVGKLDFMTLLDDQMTVNRYRQELLGREADEGKAWAELEMLTGRELIDANSIAVVAGASNNAATAKRGDK
jgi:outer membrane protein TolC